MAAQTPTVGPASTDAIDEDVLPLLNDEALRCARGLVEWATQHAATYGVRIVDARVHRWQSLEDPEWIEAVVDFLVDGDEAASQRFWEGADDELDRLAGPNSTVPVDTLWIRVQRR